MSFKLKFWSSMLGSIAFTVASPFAVAAPAPDSPLDSSAHVAAMPDAAKLLQLKIISTFVAGAPANSVVLNPGFNNLGAPITIKCVTGPTCTIVASLMGQVAPPAGALWAVCVTVDGTYASPGCPYQGTLPAAGPYVTGTGLFYSSVDVGTHFLQAQIYVSNPSTLGSWSLSATNYK